MFWWGLGRSVSEMLRCGAIWAPPSVCFERNRWPQVTPEDRAASPAPHNPLPPSHSRTLPQLPHFSKNKTGGKILQLKPKRIFREFLRLELHCTVLVNGFEDPPSSRTLALSTTFNLNLLLGQRQLVCALHIKCALDCDFGAASLPHLNLGVQNHSPNPSFDISMGPKSDHCLALSVPHWFTHHVEFCSNWICQTCEVDFTTVFVNIDLWISLSCYMDWNLVHGFI